MKQPVLQNTGCPYMLAQIASPPQIFVVLKLSAAVRKDDRQDDYTQSLMNYISLLRQVHGMLAA